MALEILALAEKHPNVAFLGAYGISTFVRLTLDPRPQPSGTMQRTVAVNWVRRPGGAAAENITRDIGWANLPPLFLKSAATWTVTKNERTINEEGAIGVIGLLIHDLEKAQIRRVVQIGGGGDYYLELEDGVETQVECSGVGVDEKGHESWSRLGKKSEQVLTKRADGFASVVCFCHGEHEEVFCYLHYVTSSLVAKAKGKKKRRRRS